MPKFKNESQEADWWASPAGRNYVERKSAAAKAAGVKMTGSSLVAALPKPLSATRRKARNAAITAFARKLAGSNLDLDRDLEAAGIEHLLRMVPPWK